MMHKFQLDPRESHFSWRGFDFPYGFQVAQDTGRDGRIAAQAQAKEANAWCLDQFGPEQDRWIRWSTKIRFRNEVDATAFRVRWC